MRACAFSRNLRASVENMSQSWKGVVLAGGYGARLWPLTEAVNKHLLALYDRPVLHFPLSVLIEAGIREIAIVSTPVALPAMRALYGDGGDFGVRLEFIEQERPDGLGSGLRVARDFSGDSNTVLALGDNVFLGRLFGPTVAQLIRQTDGASVFTTPVSKASEDGIVETRSDGRPLRVVKSPRGGGPGLAMPGLFLFDASVHRRLEAGGANYGVTDALQSYLEEGRLRLAPLPSGTQWFDVGTVSTLFSATLAVRGGVQTSVADLGGCPELAAFRQGWIDRRTLMERCVVREGSAYAERIVQILGHTPE